MRITFSKHFTGKVGEHVALLYLYVCGYHLLAYDRRGRFAQVDILAKKHQALCLVEVKVRQSQHKAHMALHPAQRSRLLKQAEDWQNHYNCTETRLDAVLIFPHWPYLQHVKSAW